MLKMTATHAILASSQTPDREIHKIQWSESYIDNFRAIIAGHGVVRSPVDMALAPVFIQYAHGDFKSADQELDRVGLTSTEDNNLVHEAFISLLFAFYAAQRFDVVAALLTDRYGFSAPLQIGALPNGPGKARIVWTIDDAGAHRFEFDATSFTSDNTRNDILCFQWTFPLYAHYAQSACPETGSVIINQGDRGATPGLSYCDSRPNYFLIPDYIFIPSRGYEYYRKVFTDKDVPWEERQPIAMWRGATTGMRAGPNDWRSLERVRMCLNLRGCSEPDLFDVGLSSVIQFPKSVSDEIEKSGLKGNFIPADQWNRFKYLLDIDGNSSPWSNLFQKLLSGSAVLKVDSYRGLQQWYYDSLKPWNNYVPISPDFSDLVEKVQWLRRHDTVAASIGRAGRDLALSLSYVSELERSVPVISAAFRYFRGDVQGVAPFGRVDADGVPRRA
jgi:hypothetical protein